MGLSFCEGLEPKSAIWWWANLFGKVLKRSQHFANGLVCLGRFGTYVSNLLMGWSVWEGLEPLRDGKSAQNHHGMIHNPHNAPEWFYAHKKWQVIGNVARNATRTEANASGIIFGTDYKKTCKRFEGSPDSGCMQCCRGADQFRPTVRMQVINRVCTKRVCGKS